jgi:hypothetical protein
MARMRFLAGLTALLITILAVLSGCGSSPTTQESQWRQDIDSSLKSLETSFVFRYRLKLERWIGVSGQSTYGDEKGEGACVDEDFIIELERTSPAGGEALAVASSDGQLYLQENGIWDRIGMEEVPSPLCDPRLFTKLVAGYGSVSLEGEEERDEVAYRRYLLQLGADKARDSFSTRAWSYFSHLRYELNCRVWLGDATTSPASMQLEVVGFDPDENLQRYRLLATMDPYDINSPDILLPAPEIGDE